MTFYLLPAASIAVDTFLTRTTALRAFFQKSPLLATLARRRAGIVLSCGVIGILSAWIGAQYQGNPEPSLPIEHANMLAAETFAAGRLANPPHPAGFFLQTHLTIQAPSYAAAVPPAPGLLLATGILLGNPVYGLWLASAGFCATVAWMLLACGAPRWALIGGAFCAVWFGFLCYWAQSFASHAAIGIGFALLWGSTQRYKKTRKPLHAMLAGASIGWLLLCDPFGLLLLAPVPLVVFFAAAKSSRNTSAATALLLIPILIGLCIHGVLNRATTDSFTKTPAMAYGEKYRDYPFFIWQKTPPPPAFDHWRMEQYDVMVKEPAANLPVPAVKAWQRRLTDIVFFYVGLPGFGIIMAACLLGLTKHARPWIWATTLIGLAPFILLSPTLGNTAGLAVTGIGLLVWSLRRIFALRAAEKRDCWRLLVLFFVVLGIASIVRGLGFTPNNEITKARIQLTELNQHLTETEGQDLVLVKYNPGAPADIEYVYNTHDPDAQDIVWARWHDQEDMSQLFNHFLNRKLWLLTVPAQGEPKLRPFEWIPPEKTAPQDIPAQGQLSDEIVPPERN